MKKQHVDRNTFDDVMVPNYKPKTIIPVKGKGVKVWDQHDNEYIDFSSGIAVNAFGHCHPKLVNALKKQSEKLWHLSNIFTNEPALKLASLLVNRTFAEKVFFCNSGSEANEAAFKLARKYAYDHISKEKYEIISFTNAFHGRSLFTVSVGGKKEYTKGFSPVPEGIIHLPFNNISALEKAISSKTCAVVLEPIQGEGGIIPADETFIKTVRKLCDKYQALMILDEVQTGIGRTGKLFSYMHYDVAPDIITSAKGLGGGFPIGAMLTTTKIANSLNFGTHGSTYGGNPLGCSVSCEVLNLMNDQLFGHVTKMGKILMSRLNELNNLYGIFQEIRGKGLLIGCELNESWKGKAKLFSQASLEHNLIILVAGLDTIRLAPPLIIIESEMIDGLYRFEKTIKKLVSQ